MLLRDIAHARSGDKGEISNVAVIAYRREHYQLLERALTPERVSAFFAEYELEEIKRYAMPKIGALNFVFKGVLRGGVTRSLALDAHCKCLGTAILGMEIDQ